MASNNNAIVVNYTSATGTFTVNGKSTKSLANGETQLIKNFAGAGTSLGSIAVSNGASSGKVDMTVSGGTNSWSTFVFTDNGYCNVFPSPNGDNVKLG